VCQTPSRSRRDREDVRHRPESAQHAKQAHIGRRSTPWVSLLSAEVQELPPTYGGLELSQELRNGGSCTRTGSRSRRNIDLRHGRRAGGRNASWSLTLESSSSAVSRSAGRFAALAASRRSLRLTVRVCQRVRIRVCAVSKSFTPVVHRRRAGPRLAACRQAKFMIGWKILQHSPIWRESCFKHAAPDRRQTPAQSLIPACAGQR
jgi:hypothetical protein